MLTKNVISIISIVILFLILEWMFLNGILNMYMEGGM